MIYLISDKEKISIKKIANIINTSQKIGLADDVKEKIIDCRNYLDAKIKQSTSPIYGVNTGFGSLCDTIIDADKIEDLQRNLVISHACGTGDVIPIEISKLMLLLKVKSLAQGKSAVHLDTVERLIYLYNNNIIPVIYEQGSLGASGDLAPLAHMSLPLLGLGKVHYKGNIRDTSEVYELVDLKPISLYSKEGLALLNGTQFMSAYGTYTLIKCLKLVEQANEIAAMSIDAFSAKLEPFHKLLHTIRPHNGQMQTASLILSHLRGSEITKQEKKQTQDPYSFRCIPQVHGATMDTIAYVASVFETEINSVTDNPTVFPEEDVILSGGNFHGQPLALTLDFLCIAMAELASIAERRIYLLISGQRDLPPYLIKDSGLNSGFMITQYTAASIVSRNKGLCMPASVDSIVSSNGQEDHVSMGANAAVKCYEVVNNVKTVLAIEWLNAAQALEFRRPLKSSELIEQKLHSLRKFVPYIKSDVLMHDCIKAAEQLLEV